MLPSSCLPSIESAPGILPQQGPNNGVGGHSWSALPFASATGSAVRTIAVIVPVRNEQRYIEGTLDALLGQEYPPDAFEIVVVDGQSTDRTPEIVRQYAAQYPNIHLRPNPKRWSSAARNIGIKQSQGELILVVDGHCELTDRRYLAKVAAAFERSGADCVGRPQPMDVAGATTLQQSIAAARSSPLGHHPDSYIYSNTEGFVPAHSVAVAYRRHVFDTVGLFDERFDACEDVDLNHRVDQAGLRCFLTPDIALRYVPRHSLRHLFHQLARYGHGRARLARKRPETISLKTFLPALMVLALGVFPAIAWALPYGLLVYAGLVATYGAALIVGTAIAAKKCKKRFKALVALPLVYVAIHWGAGIGMLWELLCPSQAVGLPTSHAPSPELAAEPQLEELARGEATRCP